jgi:hypothetical protein
MVDKARRLLKSWQYKKDVVELWQLQFLMAIYNKLGQPEKAISYMNSIPEKERSQY